MVRASRQVCALAAGLLLLTAAVRGASAAGPPTWEMPTVWDDIKAGGCGEYVIILIAIAGVAMALDLAVEDRRAVLLPPLLVSQLQQALNSGDVDKARELSVKATRLRNVLFAGLARLEASPGSTRRALDLAARQEEVRLKRRAGWPLLAAIMAALVGVFTTVAMFLKMLYPLAFMRGHPTYPDVAQCCRAALVPVFSGLLAALVFVPAWWFFRWRAEVLAHEIEATADDLISRIGTDVAGKEQAKTES